MAYSGSIDLISGIRAKNNGTFPLVDAKDVYVNDEYRLNAYLGIEEIVWSDLMNKITNSALIPGKQYRITDYVAKVANVSNVQSADHQFDLIVVADAVNKLNESARAVKHIGDSYFPATTKFESWRVCYCIENDATRFAWADATNGKGVVYRLIDENNNDIPYDFKSITYGDPGVYTLDTGEHSDGSISGMFNNIHVGRSITTTGTQLLNAVTFENGFNDVNVENGCAYIGIINGTSATSVGNITILSGLKGESYLNRKMIRVVTPNLGVHTTYIPSDSQSIEV